MSISASRAAYRAASVSSAAMTVKTVRTMRRVKSWSELIGLSARARRCLARPLRARSTAREVCREVADQRVDASQVIGRGEEHDSDVAVGWRHAEPRSVNAEHARRSEQPEHVVLVRAPGRQRNARHRVE